MKCPFKNGIHCFHKYDKLSRTPHRRVCGHKKCENCPLYLGWVEIQAKFNINEESIDKLKKVD